jgi:hypothetical protein
VTDLRPAPDVPFEATGCPPVDEVLASLTSLDEQPLAAHVGLFEGAHTRLRAVLDDAGDAGADAGASASASASG